MVTRGRELRTFSSASLSRSPISPVGKFEGSRTRTASPARRSSATSPAFLAVAAKWHALMMGDGFVAGSADEKKIRFVRIGISAEVALVDVLIIVWLAFVGGAQALLIGEGIVTGRLREGLGS